MANKLKIHKLTPEERRWYAEQWMLSRHTTLWGEYFSMEERSAAAADYLCSAIESFAEWLRNWTPDQERPVPDA